MPPPPAAPAKRRGWGLLPRLLLVAGLVLVAYMMTQSWGGQRQVAGGAARQRLRRHQASQHGLERHQQQQQQRHRIGADEEEDQKQQEHQPEEAEAACTPFPNSAAAATQRPGGKAQPPPVTIRRRTDIARVLQQEGLRIGAELGVQVSLICCWCLVGRLRDLLVLPPLLLTDRTSCRLPALHCRRGCMQRRRCGCGPPAQSTTWWMSGPSRCLLIRRAVALPSVACCAVVPASQTCLPACLPEPCLPALFALFAAAQENYLDTSNVDDKRQSALFNETQRRLGPWSKKVPSMHSSALHVVTNRRWQHTNDWWWWCTRGLLA